MSFDQFEGSTQSAAPVEIYEFARGTQIWRYTSADEPQTINSQDYPVAAIERENIPTTEELGRTNVTLTVPRDFAPIADYVAGTPPQQMALTIKRKHRPDDEVRVIWRARVLSVTFLGGLEAEIVTESVIQALQRNGLRRRFSTQCGHALYDSGCQVSEGDFQKQADLSAVDGAQLTSSTFATEADGWWVAGFVELSGARQLIKSHSGDTVTLDAPLPGAEVGDQVRALPGCDHTFSTCVNKFSNPDNYGGFPFHPESSPFGGGRIEDKEKVSTSGLNEFKE